MSALYIQPWSMVWVATYRVGEGESQNRHLFSNQASRAVCLCFAAGHLCDEAMWIGAAFAVSWKPGQPSWAGLPFQSRLCHGFCRRAA